MVHDAMRKRVGRKGGDTVMQRHENTGVCAVELDCTVPPGRPAPGATTLSARVKVTGCALGTGLVDEVRRPVVWARVTVMGQ